MPLPVLLVWLLLVWSAGWFAFPLSRRLVGHALPDGGLALGRIAFLTMWTLCAFWLGSAGVPTAISAWIFGPLALLGLWSWKRTER